MDTLETAGTAGIDTTGAGLDPRLAAMMSLFGHTAGGAAGASPADVMTALQAQLDQAAARNPQLAPLLQMLRERTLANPAAADRKQAPADAEPPSAAESATPRDADVQDLLLLARQLEDEVQALRLRNDALAAALGACHLCFGEHGACDLCSGLGMPGWQRPDAAAFRRYVTPSVRRVQAEAWPPAPAGQRRAATPPVRDARRRPASPPESKPLRSTEGLRAAAEP